MTNEELIKRLQEDLGIMMEWARNVSDEYLDGDPDARQQFLADMERASNAYRMKPEGKE